MLTANDLGNEFDGLFSVIKCSIWGGESCKANAAIFEEMSFHAIDTLPAHILSSIEMPNELYQRWIKAAYQRIAFNVRYIDHQARLPITVPYVILKGSAAAQYYIHPEVRTMGDVDIMTDRDDFEVACNELISQDFKEVQSNSSRHRIFNNGEILVEVHRYFASLNDPIQARYLDELIISNINPSHYLPDLINGLVILEHISQHLENGLGLRQIIDWMMFANKCLSNSNWKQFEVISQRIGLNNLAMVITRTCEMYLGLPKKQWTYGVDDRVCSQLMWYILSCGNFGSKKSQDVFKGESVFSYMYSPIVALTMIQRSGLKTWKAASKYRFLRPFAWIYQLVRLLVKGLSQKRAFSTLLSEYHTAKKKRALFEALGVKTKDKGIVKYVDGEYV